jgi:HAD superfamily hydrolase (TIGR01509 family)
MKKKQALFFDLDGTLIRSERVALDAIHAVLLEEGNFVKKKDLECAVGKTWSKAVEEIKKANPSLSLPPEFSVRVLRKYRELLREKLEPVEGAVQAIETLSSVFRLVVVSGSHREDISFALSKLGIEEYFEFYLGAKDYKNSKPDPEPYLKALELAKIEKESVLVFEDSPAGISSALAAGLGVVAITESGHAGDAAKKAHWQVKDFTSIDVGWVESRFIRRH